MDRFGVGVVGLGEFGERHLRVYRDLPNVDTVAVCSRSAQRAEELARKYGARRWYTDLEPFVADPQIEALSVVTSENRHLRPVLLAIEAGKHVLVEKPIAVDVGEAQQMVEASSQASVFVMPGHIMRFDPRYALVKQEIEDGKLGEVATIYARRNVSRRFDLPMAERAHPAFRTGVHDIDIALWYIGGRVVRVYALERNLQGKNYPDILWALLEFANGPIMCLESNWIVPRGAGLRSETLTEIIGTKGAARIRPPTDSLLLMYDQDRLSPNTVWWPTVHGGVSGALRNELAYFVRCVTEGTRPSVVTMEEALQSIRVAAAIVRSAQSGKEVYL